MSENNIPDDDFQNRWESILSESDIKSVPINLIKDITIKMADGTVETFNVLDLKESGLSFKEIEVRLREYLDENDDLIASLDFHLNVVELASKVEKITKRFLG